MESLFYVSRGKTGEEGTGKRDYRNTWPCVSVCEHRWFPFQNYRMAHCSPDALSI